MHTTAAVSNLQLLSTNLLLSALYLVCTGAIRSSNRMARWLQESSEETFGRGSECAAFFSTC
jgi:hypothetical protein